jgi:hypothetical protein
MASRCMDGRTCSEMFMAVPKFVWPKCPGRLWPWLPCSRGWWPRCVASHGSAYSANPVLALCAPQSRSHDKEKTLWEDNEDSHSEKVVQDRRAEQIEKRLIQALNYVQEHGFITNGIYRQLTGVTDRTAHRDLEKLVERGRLKGTGQRAARRYVLA